MQAEDAAATAASGVARAKIAPFPEPMDFEPMPVPANEAFVIRYLNCTSNKPLHLGHLRNIALGEATVASLRAIGTHAVGHCVLEDTGRFMSEAMAAIRSAEGAGEIIPAPGPRTDHFVGDCYARYRAARAASAANAQAVPGEAPAAAASTEYDARNDEADDLMRALLREEPAALALRTRVRTLATTGQHATLERLGVSIDFCDFESAEDQVIDAFAARCDQAGLLHDDAGERVWHSSSGKRLRFINKAGLYEESARLLSFNARVAKTPATAYRTIVFAGSEWRASMRLYAEFLAALGVDVADKYLPTFYGMVMLNGKKMASSAGTGVLVDDMLDDLAANERAQDIAARSVHCATPEDIAAIVIRIFLLSSPRTDAINYSPDLFAGADSDPAWRIAEVCATLPGQAASCSKGNRMILQDAVERRSYEKVVHRTHLLAEGILEGGPTREIAGEFRCLTQALSLANAGRLMTFSNLPSFLTAPGGEENITRQGSPSLAVA
jgi:arginyl-tRNA synthetase